MLPRKIRRRFSVEHIRSGCRAIAINLVQDGMDAQARLPVGVGMDHVMLVCRIVITLQFNNLCVFINIIDRSPVDL